MIKLLAFAFLLGVATAAVAQAPIERRPPSPLFVPAINRWPQADAISHHKRLIVTLKSDYGVTHLCRLNQLGTDMIACEGRHHQLVSYPRADVNTISILQTHMSFSTYVLGVSATVAIVGICVGSAGLFLLGLVIEGFAFPATLEPDPPPTGKLIYLAESDYATAP